MILGVPSIGQIDLFKNCKYSIGTCVKKNLRNNYPKNINIKQTMNAIPKPRGIKSVIKFRSGCLGSGYSFSAFLFI